MAKEKIAASDHMASFARSKRGDADWIKVWDYNKHLREASLGRYSPYMLFHGDKRKTTALPDGAPMDEAVVPPKVPPRKASESADAHHPHLTGVPKLRLRMQVLGEDGKPMAGAVYTLKIEGAAITKVMEKGKSKAAPDELKLDDKGMLDVVIDNVQAHGAVLKVQLPSDEEDSGSGTGSTGGTGGTGGTAPTGTPPSGTTPPTTPPTTPVVPEAEWIEYRLTIGRLNPIKGKAPDEWCIAGVQQRLNNLGYGAGCIDGIAGIGTRAALKRFQGKNEVTEEDADITRFQTEMDIDKDKDPYPDGVPGPKTRAALEKIHDTPSTSMKDPPPKAKTSGTSGGLTESPAPAPDSSGSATGEPAPTPPVETAEQKAKKKYDEAVVERDNARDRRDLAVAAVKTKLAEKNAAFEVYKNKRIEDNLTLFQKKRSAHEQAIKDAQAAERDLTRAQRKVDQTKIDWDREKSG